MIQMIVPPMIPFYCNLITVGKKDVQFNWNLVCCQPTLVWENQLPELAWKLWLLPRSDVFSLRGFSVSIIKRKHLLWWRVFPVCYLNINRKPCPQPQGQNAYAIILSLFWHHSLFWHYWLLTSIIPFSINPFTIIII